MKKIFVLIFLALSLTGFSQIVPGTGGNFTITHPRIQVPLNFIPPVYADTTAANLDLGIDSSFAIIATRNPMSLWMRHHSPKRWVIYGTGATPPAGSNRDIQFNDASSMGATSAFRYTSSGYVDLSYGGLVLLSGADNAATTRTNVTAKTSTFAIPHYTTAEENVLWAKVQSFSGTNSLAIGGGDASYNAINDMRFYAGSSATATTGTEKLRLTNTGLYVGTGANPSSKLHIEAGTTTVAPLQFTSGPVNTSAAAGRMEYDGDLKFSKVNNVRYVIGGSISNNVTSVAVTGSSAQDLQTYTVPAGTLSATGAYLEVRAVFFCQTVSENFKLSFGSTNVVDMTTGAVGTYYVTGTITRTGAATQEAHFLVSGAESAAFITSPTETLSNAITLKGVGEGLGAGDITQYQLNVKYFGN